MHNKRQKTNTANQNEKHYKIISLHKIRKTWNIPCDYYITGSVRLGSYRSGVRFEVTKERQQHCIQFGIQITDNNVRKVFDNLDVNKYVLKSVSGYSINKTSVHKAFNAFIS